MRTNQSNAGGKIAAPCGSWASDVGAGLVAGKTTALSMLRADAGRLLWLEGRPSEGGRTALCCQDAAGHITEMTAAPLDVGSRVHEYGGGAYAASGGWIAFSNRPDGSVWLIEPDTRPRPVCTVAGLRFADFCFAPGMLLAVREDHRNSAGQPEATIVALSLDASRDPATNAGDVLVRGPDFVSSPRLAPDGRSLAWIEWDHPDMPWDATRLQSATLRIAPDHSPTLSNIVCIAGAAEREALLQPLYDSDGRLHVCSDRSGWWNLYRLTPDGLLSPICPMQSEIGLPPWMFGQRSYDFLGDGSLIAACIEAGRSVPIRIADSTATTLPVGPVVECPVLLKRPGATHLAWLSASPDQPATIMTAALEDMSTPQPVIAAHALDVPAEAIARAETVRFRGSHGSPRHAFYYAPASDRFRAPDGELPPLVVMAHGGPTGMTSDALSLRVQWWTSRGIAVVDVNYGGSTGFGRAYRQTLDGQWGVVDVDDCIAACRHLVETGRADPARIAIRGSSAGGFTVLAALTRSRIFSAAACLYGIGDLRGLAADTHKFESRYLDRLIGRLPEDGAIYDARSPIRHLDAMTCPVIFFHGHDDKVVPIGQTRDMAAALRARGIPVDVHEFAGEAHGFRREDTIRQVLELELAFYGSRFGFTPSGSIG